MRHAGKRTVGTVAIGLLVAMLMASVFGAAILAAPHSGGATRAAAAHATNLGLSGHPAPAAAVHPGAATATITAVNTAAKYQIIPFVLELQITTNAHSLKHNTSLWVNVVDNVTGTFCISITGNTTLHTGATTNNLSFDPVSLGTALSTCPFLLQDTVILNADFHVRDNFTGVPSYANASLQQATAFIFSPLNVVLLSPSGSVGAGNVSLMATYTAQYLTSVRILVYSAGKASVLFNGSLQWANAQTPAVGIWFAANPGSYPYDLTITTAYGSLTSSGSIVVLPGAGTPVYVNKSTYQNSSIFPGVSGAVSGTILLVVGLILGMIVALAVGRSLMRPAAAAPAQPWQPSGTGANQCSVCGKSFATPEELQAHAKSEHGMT